MTVQTDTGPARYLRSVRIEATYGAVPWACPESVTVEWCEPETMPTATEINVAIAQLAAVPALARIDGEPRVPPREAPDRAWLDDAERSAGKS